MLLDIEKIYKISKKILKIEEELDLYAEEFLISDRELDPDEVTHHQKLEAKRDKLKEKLKNHLLNR